MPCSAVTSWVAKPCAAFSNCAAFCSSPLARASSASTSAWRAEACSFSTSPSWRFSFISSWRWLPITAAACWDSAWCCRCASSMACWICTFGSACSSIFDENDAIRYFQNFTNGLAISYACLLGAGVGSIVSIVRRAYPPTRGDIREHPDPPRTLEYTPARRLILPAPASGDAVTPPAVANPLPAVAARGGRCLMNVRAPVLVAARHVAGATDVLSGFSVVDPESRPEVGSPVRQRERLSSEPGSAE